MKTNKKMLDFAQQLQSMEYNVELIMKGDIVEHIAVNKENEKRQYLISFHENICSSGIFAFGELCNNLHIGYYDGTKEFSNPKILDFFNTGIKMKDDFYRTLECCRDENYIEKDSDYEELFSKWIKENGYSITHFT